MPRITYILFYVILSLIAITPLRSGPYPPAVGTDGSDAIAATDPRIVAWATTVHTIAYGAEVTDDFKNPDRSLGPATTDAERDIFHVVSLGDSGSITLGFSLPIRDGNGPDFAVFENSFNNYFLELAFVEVSSNGTDFVRFPNHSLTPQTVGPFPTAVTGVNPTNINGLAGKYRVGFGTPFDLNELRALPESSTLDFEAIRYVRIVDVIGDGSALDSFGNPIYDPHPTIGSAGFDLDALGVINRALPHPGTLELRTQDGTIQLFWRGQLGITYQLEWSSNLQDWTSLGEQSATGDWLLWENATEGRDGFFRLSAVGL